MKETTNFKLNKPENTDIVDIAKLNENMDILDTEVEQNKTDILSANTKLGSVAMTTTAQTVTGAINELDVDIGDKSTLTTDNKTNLVGAINEHEAQIENLSNNINTIETIPLVEGYYQSRDILPTSTRGNLNVKVFGNTAVNSLVNSDFSNGTTGWAGNGATLSVISNTLSITGNGTSSLVSGTQLLNMHGNKRMYRMRARVTNSSCTRIEIRNSNGTLITTVNSPVINTWYNLIAVGIPNDEMLLLSHRYADATTANGKIMEVQEVMAIDMGSDSSNPDYNLTADEMNTKYPVYFDRLQGATNIEVLSVGKNLFDGELELGGIDITTGQLLTLTDRIRSKNYITTDKLQTILSSPDIGINVGDLRFAYYDDTFKFITTSTSSLITLSSYKYVKFFLAGTTNLSLRFQLEKGTTATSYEPYKPISVLYKTLDGKPVTLHRLPNGVRDEIDENGRKVERCLEYELKASDIVSITNYAPNYAIYTRPFTDNRTWTNAVGNSIIVEGMSEIAGDSVSTAFVDGVYGTTSAQVIKFGSTTITTLADAQTALAGTKIVYQKATPDIIDTNATPLIAEPNGTVFISSENSPLPASEMSYTNNVGAVINGLIDGQKELSELLTKKANRLPLNWVQATLQNGWVNIYAYAPTVYFKDDFGVVTVKGMIKDGTLTTGTVIFNLPKGYRPSVSDELPIFAFNASTGNLVTMEVAGNGNVMILGTTTTGGIRFNGSFIAEA